LTEKKTVVGVALDFGFKEIPAERSAAIDKLWNLFDGELMIPGLLRRSKKFLTLFFN
jgi:hypothetical protein